MAYNNIIFEITDQIATITINRPKALNALNTEVLNELLHAVESVAADEEIRVLILTGSGEKAFVAGADIAELAELNSLGAKFFAVTGHKTMDAIGSLAIPVIAAVNGFALGGGLELALACHVRYAAAGARLGLPEIKLGIIPGFGGTQRLAHVAGKARALEMMLSGEPVDAQTAERYGIVQGVVADDPVLEHAARFAERLAGAAPHAVSAILAAADRGPDMSLDAALEFETARFALCCASQDMREGTAAFLEKRKPEFTGR